MKKIISFLICTTILFSSTLITANAGSSIDLNISKDDISGEVQSNTYGISADKISNLNGTDISSNLVYNNSFEHYSTTEKGSLNEDYWHFSNVEHSVKHEDSMNKNNSNYEVIKVSKKGTISNLGYVENGKKDKKSSATIGFKKGTKYDFSCFIKNIDFEGTILVYLNSPSNKNVVTELDISNCKAGWREVSATLESSKTESGSLSIEFNGTGTLQLDFVSLIPQDSYGYGKSEWKFSPIRYDLQKAIANLKPSHIRIPLIIDENISPVDYSWKNTVGPAEERKYTENNTSETGFGEYFNLCDEIGAEPIPVLTANVAELNEIELKNYIQDIYDLVEYANGGSIKTYWGAIRSGHGHSEPYNLKAIELIGDGSTNFNKVLESVNKKHPEIRFISSLKSESVVNKSDIETAFDYAYAALYYPDWVQNDTQNSLFKLLSNVDFTNVSLTPSYFTQMIFANNCGNKHINTSFLGKVNNIFQSVTVNESEQVIYVKIVNQSSSSQVVNVNLNGFKKANYASMQSISGNRLSSKNKAGSPYYIAPKDTKLNVKDDSVTVEVQKYSTNVVRIAYGSNDGTSLYKLPADTPVAEDFISDPVKIVIPCGILCVIALSAIITVLVKSSKKKKNK